MKFRKLKIEDGQVNFVPDLKPVSGSIGFPPSFFSSLLYYKFITITEPKPSKKYTVIHKYETP